MTILPSEHTTLLVIIVIGMAIGRIRIKGISLDVAAVILTAMIFGWFGITVPDVFQKIGIVLFIYCIGLQAGPSFFEAFKKQGRHLLILAAIIVATGAGLSVGIALLLEKPLSLAAGLFAGALTSTPALAAALEVSKNPELTTIAYGLAYPAGIVVVVLFVNLIPRLLKINLAKEENEYLAEMTADHPLISHKHFVVVNANIAGKTIGELKIRTMTHAAISRVSHAGVASFPAAHTVLHEGDLIRAVGTNEALDRIRILIGPETVEDIPMATNSEVNWFIVTNKKIVNKTLREIGLTEAYGAIVTRIRRSGLDLVPHINATVRFGDKLLLVCNTGHVPAIAKLLGNDNKKLSETDFFPIALGLLVGVALGVLPITHFGNYSFKLGLAGGVLLAALLLGRLGKTGPIIWNISGPANQLLRHLGLLFFMASAGTAAGKHMASAVGGVDFSLMAVSVVIVAVPLMVAFLIGWFILKMNFFTLMGSLTGGMTSATGLVAASAQTKTDAPTIAYATTYPVAMVFKIILILILCAL